MNRQNTEDLEDSENTLCDTIMMEHAIMHSSKLTECTVPGVRPKVSEGLWMIMMCRYRLTHCNKYTILVGGVDIDEGYAWWERGYMGTLYVLLNFAENLKLF